MKINFNKVLSFPLFAILLGLFPLVGLWANNELQIKPQAAWLPLLFTLLGLTVVWGACALLLRSFGRGNLLAAFIFIWFFSYGHVYSAIKGIVILGVELGYLKLFIIYVVLLVLLFVFFRKIKTPSTTVSLFLNLVFTGLLVFNVLQIIAFQNQVKSENVAPVSSASTVTAQKDAPDIYYIILDAYSRQDILAEKFDYDNSPFIDGLRQRGFYVADCANSNYIETLESVGSSLNYTYLKDLFADKAADQAGMSGAIQNNAIRKDMAGLGYQFVTAAGYSSFNDIQNSDLYLSVLNDPEMKGKLQSSQFSNFYLQTTMMRALYEMYSLNPSDYKWLPSWLKMDASYLGEAKYWYYQTNYVFDQLAELPARDGNYFVYAHINSPHGPFVFDSEGNFRYTDEPADIRPAYRDTVTYLNKRVLALVDTLISQSDVPPVIIIQGDHGARSVNQGTDKNKILEAYYFPGHSEIPLKATLTPVNTFRMVLKYYFGKDIELLPDEIISNVDYNSPSRPSQCQYP